MVVGVGGIQWIQENSEEKKEPQLLSQNIILQHEKWIYHADQTPSCHQLIRNTLFSIDGTWIWNFCFILFSEETEVYHFVKQSSSGTDISDECPFVELLCIMTKVSIIQPLQLRASPFYCTPWYLKSPEVISVSFSLLLHTVIWLLTAFVLVWILDWLTILESRAQSNRKSLGFRRRKMNILWWMW